MSPVRSTGQAVARSHAPTRAIDPAGDLVGLSVEQWEGIDEEMRRNLLENLDSRYKQYLSNFYDVANRCVERHDACIRNHRMWRYIAIVGTGVLACLNFIAAKRSIAAAAFSVIPIVAAIMAFALAVLANLETFIDPASMAEAYRESRDSYLDAAEQYDLAWSVKVVALGDTALAYTNALELYARIVAADRELRRSFKEPTKHSK